MIDKIGPRRRSQSGMKQRLRISQALLSLATAGGLVLGVMVLAAPGQAEPPSEADTPSAVEESAEPTPDPTASPAPDGEESGDGDEQGADTNTEPSESADPENDVDAKQPSPKPTEEETSGESNVCDPLDSGKINVSGSVSSITVTVESLSLPPGSLIDEYCVKAGSANQGDGPHYESFAPTTSVTITYPGGKDISHYSVGWQSPLNGSFQIMKELMNPDEADVPETFAIDYECKMDDQVTKTGTENVPADSMGVSVDEVPVGSSCTITEQPLQEIEGFTWSPVVYDPQTILIDSAEGSFSVKAKNEITKKQGGGGGLELVKELTGGPDGYTGPFTIEYQCTKEDHTPVSGSEEVAAGSSVIVSGIGNGYECVVSEPVLPDAPTGYSFGDPTFDPSNTVKINSGETATVTTRNSLEQNSGSLQIRKEIQNPDGADVPETFSIDYECVIDETVTKSGSEDVAPGMAGVTVSGIPTGSTCTITEQALPEVEGFTWAIPSYNPRSGAVDIESDEQTYVVKVINQIFKDNPGRGQLELAKELTGGPESYTGPFTLEYVCSKEGHDDVSGSRTVDAGSSAVISDIRPGSDCVVSEPNLPNPPNGYSFGEPTFDPSNSVTIKSKDKVTVTTENTLTRDEGNLRITKSLTGTPADFDPEFDVSYVCTSEGEDTISGSTTVANGGTVEVPTQGSIPAGYECTVTEGALPTLPAGYTWNTPGYSNNQGTDPGNVVTIVKNTVQLPDQELPVDQMATVAIANSATIPTVPVTPSSGGGVEVPTPATPVTPVEPASPVEPAVPVEPASPVEPAVPVEPASPDTPAAVEPAGVPLLVPAGGGAAAGIADDLPVVTYLLVILGMGSALAGAAYLLRSR